MLTTPSVILIQTFCWWYSFMQFIKCNTNCAKPDNSIWNKLEWCWKRPSHCQFWFKLKCSALYIMHLAVLVWKVFTSCQLQSITSRYHTHTDTQVCTIFNSHELLKCLGVAWGEMPGSWRCPGEMPGSCHHWWPTGVCGTMTMVVISCHFVINCVYTVNNKLTWYYHGAISMMSSSRYWDSTSILLPLVPHALILPNTHCQMVKQYERCMCGNPGQPWNPEEDKDWSLQIPGQHEDKHWLWHSHLKTGLIPLPVPPPPPTHTHTHWHVIGVLGYKQYSGCESMTWIWGEILSFGLGFFVFFCLFWGLVNVGQAFQIDEVCCLYWKRKEEKSWLVLLLQVVPSQRVHLFDPATELANTQGRHRSCNITTRMVH